MSWLLDTNVLLRLADTQSSEHAAAEAAIERLLAGEESVFISTQGAGGILGRRHPAGVG
jgi:predicted nucleic acid-binding protein